MNNSFVEIPVSVGELIDKISILYVKKNKITDVNKLKYVNEELDFLNKISESLIDGTETKKNLQELIKINSELWDIEDKIRFMEHEKNFKEEFIEVARKVYMLNDSRFEVKNYINEKFQSTIREVKSYIKY